MRSTEHHPILITVVRNRDPVLDRDAGTQLAIVIQIGQLALRRLIIALPLVAAVKGPSSASEQGQARTQQREAQRGEGRPKTNHQHEQAAKDRSQEGHGCILS